jgi:hypothetical protein
VDADEYSRESLASLKDHNRDTFSETNQAFDYSLEYEGMDDSVCSIPKVVFNGLSAFGDVVSEIAKEYFPSLSSDSKETEKSLLIQISCCKKSVSWFENKRLY